MDGHSSILFLPVAVLIAIGFLFGCDVREDRGSCPCLLTFDLSRTGDSSGCGVVLTVSAMDGSEQASDTAQGMDGLSNVTFQIAQGKTYLLTAYSSDCLSPNPYDGVVCEGASPKVWMWSDTLTAGGEDVTVSVHLHKSHCNVTLTLNGNVDDGGGRLAVRDPVAGLSPMGEPVEGVRSFELTEASAGVYEFSVLRHAGYPLWLDVTGDGGVIRSFSLGGYISNAGYDWTAEDLQDISIHMDCSLTDLSLDGDLWNAHFTTAIVI